MDTQSTSARKLMNSVPMMDLSDPDEMIRANGAAEAAQTDRLREEVEDYSRVIEELRTIYEKNNELVQKLQFMNRSTSDEIRQMIEENNARISEKLDTLEGFDQEAMKSEIVGAVDASGEKILGAVTKVGEDARTMREDADSVSHKEHVRVYRNVQASMVSELQKQTQELSTQIEALAQTMRPDPELEKRQKTWMLMTVGIFAIQIIEMILLLVK